jgi:hypothetical protein
MTDRILCVDSKYSNHLWFKDLWGVSRWGANNTAINVQGRYALVWMLDVYTCALFAGLEHPRHKACIVDDYGTLVPVDGLKY